MGKKSFLLGAALTAFGAGTILFNGYNWAVIRRAQLNMLRQT